MPAPMARNRALSRVIDGSRKCYVIEKYSFISKRGAKSYHKGGGEALRDARALDGRVARQTPRIGWIVFPADQRLEIASAGRGDPESIGREEGARHLLFLIGDRRQRCLADGPAVGRWGLAYDGGHHGVLALEREFDR